MGSISFGQDRKRRNQQQTILIKQQVLGFQVSVRDVFAVHVLEGAHNLCRVKFAHLHRKALEKKKKKKCQRKFPEKEKENKLKAGNQLDFYEGK